MNFYRVEISLKDTEEGRGMKKIAALIAAGTLGMFLIAATTAQARSQQSAAKEQKLDKLEKLSKQLNLTPEQKVKLIPILKADAPKIQAIKDNTSLTKLQKVEQIRAVREQSDPQVKAILTPEQYQQLQTIRQQEVQSMIQRKRAQQ
jgi:Spy/CpxP family protein refolding chaperone